MRWTYRLYAFAAVYIFFLVHVKGQENPGYRKLISETNRLYGSNDLLHSGEIYRPEHIHAKGNPYFFSKDYSPASVTVKENKFENVTAKYNIETDRLVILTPADSNSVTVIALKQNWVDSFVIHNHLFVNISNYDSTEVLTGYYELLYHGKKSLFIKYNKKFIDTYNDLSPNGFYSTVKTSLFIFDGVKFILVKNRKAFLRLYGANKIPVKQYLRANKIKFLKASSIQFKKLMHFSDELPVSN